MAVKKGESKISVERVARQIQSRFNPIRNLTPERLAVALDNFEAGYLRDAAMIWQKIFQRDDQLQAVGPKRYRAVSRLPWEVLTIDESPEAELHKEALEFFYNNLTATSALDRNQPGGFATLVKQMMTAVAYRYSVHEILWQATKDPATGRDAYTAKFVHVPLQFFENTTGELRFLPEDTALAGESLEKDGWMVTGGDGLMEACSVAYMFKRLPMGDWLTYTEKFGLPWVHGKTNAALDSPEWKAFATALANLGNDCQILTNNEAAIEMHNAGTAGALPHPPLIERMDRAMAILWRGGDLSTMSQAGDSSGSNQQGEERTNIEADDAANISEVLNTQIERQIGRMLFGTEHLLAYVKIAPPERVDTAREMAVWKGANELGVPLAVKDFRERFGLPAPDKADELLRVASAALAPNDPYASAANAATAMVNRATQIRDLMDADREAMQPIIKRLEDLDPNDEAAVRALRDDLPDLLGSARGEAFTTALETVLAEALVAGVKGGSGK
jgi:phage gp29-like protein